MLQFLFRRLTGDATRGEKLFLAVSGLAREPHWYVEGKVPDTLNGRFSVLATITALVLVRLEAEGEDGNAASVALTERFIEVMESEHRELGLGDPGLGRTVRRLVGSLARRTELWRSALAVQTDWTTAVLESLYKADAQPGALEHSVAALEQLWAALQRRRMAELEEGKLS